MPPPPSCDAQDVVPPLSACWSFRRWAEATTSAPTTILAHAKARYPSINPSTVYRTLDALVEAGIARRTDLGSDRLFYEVAREHRHHHAVCQDCGAVAHLHDASLRPLAQALEQATGFTLSPDREIDGSRDLPGMPGGGARAVLVTRCDRTRAPARPRAAPHRRAGGR